MSSKKITKTRTRRRRQRRDIKRHLIITDFEKFKSIYLNDEFEEEDTNEDEPTYAKIC